MAQPVQREESAEPEASDPVTAEHGYLDSLEFPSFAECYRELRPEMVRLALVLTRSEEVAQDLVQDAFVRLHSAWSHVREPRSYLRRSVVNACNSHHRRRRIERKYQGEITEGVTEFAGSELSDQLLALPRRQRLALILRYYADLPDADIAVALRCRPGTVASLIHRGLAELRRNNHD